LNLPIVVGEEPGFGPLQDPKLPSLKTRCVLAGTNPSAAGFDADHSDPAIAQEWVKQPNRVASTSDTCHEQIWQPFFLLKDLSPGFIADNPMQITNHHGVRMWTVSGSKQVMCRTNVGDPIAHGFVDRFFQSRLACGDRDNFCPEEFHSRDVECLTSHIDLPHVNNAFKTKSRRNRRCRDTMLTRSGFCNDSSLAHPSGKQDLAHRVIDFVSARVQKVFPLEINSRPLELFGESLGIVERRWPPTERAQQVI
jgi:hypothetical protein